MSILQSLKNLPDVTRQQRWELKLANLTPDSVDLTTPHQFDVETILRVSQYKTLIPETTSSVNGMKLEWERRQVSVPLSLFIYPFIHSCI